MDMEILRSSLEHACLQARAEYRLHQTEDGLNIALAKISGIVAGCIVSARAMEGDSRVEAVVEIAREIAERHQRELLQESDF